QRPRGRRHVPGVYELAADGPGPDAIMSDSLVGHVAPGGPARISAFYHPAPWHAGRPPARSGPLPHTLVSRPGPGRALQGAVAVQPAALSPQEQQTLTFWHLQNVRVAEHASPAR